jgi:8-oxo-dGTP pyrophosphatase MutT (NUDIX family)
VPIGGRQRAFHRAVRGRCQAGWIVDAPGACYGRKCIELEVLLITSRDTGRWVIPRGNVEPGQTARQAAKREAYEEAGIRGTVRAAPLGMYTYDKVGRPGLPLHAVVEVCTLHVARQAKTWPERSQRRTQWFDTVSAADLVHERGLALLILRLPRDGRCGIALSLLSSP